MAAASTCTNSSELAQQLQAMPAGQRRAHVEAFVLKTVTQLTDSAVEPTMPLMEAGVDSLAATELTSRLSGTTELDLPSTLLTTPSDTFAKTKRTCVRR